MSAPKDSGQALNDASKSTDTYSGEGQGAAGVIDQGIAGSQDALDKSGESGIITPPEGGFKDLHVGLQWNNIIVEQSRGFMGLIKKSLNKGVDLDLGCFFELVDGTRGILQPFGELFGAYNRPPYIESSGDERTGDAEGDDEYFTINGAQWPKIKRVLIYTYIYEGSNDWSQIKPEININLHNGDPIINIKPTLQTNNMTVCALATINNVKDGIQIVTHGEYFTSQASMDRAYGFGFKWEDGAKG